MPQMAPLWWTSLFMTFFISFTLMWMMMYFITSSLPLSSKKSIIKTQLNWKW